MPTLKELRLEARLSLTQLARLADVDRQTVDRAENGEPVRDFKASAIAQALARQLNREIKLDEIEGLNIL